MINGKTTSGFEYVLDINAVDDMELFEMMADVDDNPLLLPKILNQLLGKHQKEALYNHCRTDKGNVPIEAIVKELSEIFAENQDLKNSSSLPE